MDDMDTGSNNSGGSEAIRDLSEEDVATSAGKSPIQFAKETKEGRGENTHCRVEPKTMYQSQIPTAFTE